jgi:signal transduction histidine kinase
MFADVRRRLALLYAAIFATTLLLLGPVLYLSVAHQLAQASDATLRLAAQREAALAFTGSGVTLGISSSFAAPPPLALQDVFYILLTPAGRVRATTASVLHPGLPDRRAALQAAHQRFGVFSTLPTRDAGDIRLFTVPIMRGGQVVALLQAGRALAALAAAQRSLLFFLLGLGAAAVAAATVGGLLLTRQAMRPIRAAFGAQRAFVADASHELRTPLTLIRTNAEVLLEAGAVAEAEDRALVEDIVGEAEHMGRLIGDLLTLARLDAGALPLARVAVALDTLVRATSRQMARLAAQHAVRLLLGPVEPVSVQGDAGRLEQVLLILLDNAIKYNQAGGSVAVTLRRAKGQAVLEVRDTGRGIPAAELPSLFARFHRGPGAGVAAEGSGLGLAIAHGIVQAHRGCLRVRSVPGVGSTFTVLLPLAPQALRAEPPGLPAAAGGA